MTKSFETKNFESNELKSIKIVCRRIETLINIQITILQGIGNIYNVKKSSFYFNKISSQYSHFLLRQTIQVQLILYGECINKARPKYEERV